MYIWEAHPNEIIWDIKHHPTEPMILSAGADDVIALWKTPSQSEIEKLLEDESENRKLEDKIFLKSYQLKTNALEYTDTPTCLEWANSDKFVAFYNTGMAGLFDYNHEQSIHTFSYLEDVNRDPKTSQINAVAKHPQLNIIFTVSEDRKIRVFDLNAK